MPGILVLLSSALELWGQAAGSHLTFGDHRRFKTPAGDTAQLLRSGNGVVAVQVRATTDTLPTGHIVHAGLFNIGTAQDQPLLFDFPAPPQTSHLNLWLDGALYSNDPLVTGLPNLPLAQAPLLLPDGTIQCEYRVGQFALTQRLRPEQFSDTTGAIFMQYLLTNYDTQAHQAGLLLELDTKINQNDATPFLTSAGYSRAEKVFAGAAVPDFYLAFEFGPDSSGLVAQGTLARAHATRPDFLAIGDWINLSQVQWDYTPDTLNFKDSALLLRWDPVPLAPGETRSLATYYGLGDVQRAPGVLSLNLNMPARLTCVNDSLAPNPFSVSLLVSNRGFSTAQQVVAELELPPGLLLAPGEFARKSLTPDSLAPQASGTVAWSVRALPVAADVNLRVRAMVTARGAPENAVETTLALPYCRVAGFEMVISPRRRALQAGSRAEFQVLVQPLGSFNQPVALSLWPALPGVSAHFEQPVVSPGSLTTLVLQTAASLLAGTYDFIITGRAGNLAVSDTISLEVAGVLLDHDPPFTTGHNPGRGAVNVLPEGALTVEIHDTGAGVDSATIVLAVNDRRVTPVISGSPPNYLVRYQPQTAWHYNEEVTVSVRAADLASPPNLMPEERYRFSIVRDEQPPFVSDRQPAAGAQEVAANTAISFHLRDEASGVAGESLALWVNGAAVVPALSGGPRDYLVQYQPAVAFAPGENVTVRITAHDRALPPNHLVEEFSFRVRPAVYDLMVTVLRPLGDLRPNAGARVVGEIRNRRDAIAEPFRLELRRDGELVQDTLITAMAGGATLSKTFAVNFRQTGSQRLLLRVDADDQIAEEAEDNNSQELVVELLPAEPAPAFSVRPNPFTPNHDGYNDAVKFSYAGLALAQPGLRVFDTAGRTVLSVDRLPANEFLWDGRDDHGRPLPPGVYLYSLQNHGRNVKNGYVVLAR
ncbi:MAG: gliding motility-associated C-terminal domain-containing protein [candidate division KSB1 bacterium]|nr:gliding motility-associated C-terminal domain-containing protein [candidate division KSB1 bacterium]MDZ7275004.1 gliding motility-associated C-terminal domain-containing protein [candidate division KSB1 bacterium]MDZ7286547.1 gliding motility-associated C-terminal domain-containing protein [candidate division KSB1 bacterium]MDZ7299289.1 gliding motility-associated C-terminal domain-containing protein [candidate division KSB1 bacterium]MDZ7307372.1 gliding motility-associated C-terminal domai